MVWASILLAFLRVPSVTFGSFLARVSYSLGINPAAVPLFRRRFSKSFLSLIFHWLFGRVSHGLGLNPSSFFTPSVGNVRQFSGSCFVQFLGASILQLFRCFRKRFSKSFLALILPRLFARVSHGLGLNPSSFFMRSLGNVRQFSGSCFVQFGHQSCSCSAVSEAFLQVTRSLGNVRQFSGSCFVQFGHQSCSCSAVSEAFLQVIPCIDSPSAFRSCFAWFGPQSF